MAEESRDLERMLGDPRGAIRSMLLPLIVSYLVVQINLFADTSWCSGLGADASSAVSTISPIYWVVSGLGTGLGIGAATSIARYLGRGEKHNADRLVTQTIILSVIIGVVTTPVIFLAVNPALAMMGRSRASSGPKGRRRGPWWSSSHLPRSTWSSTRC